MFLLICYLSHMYLLYEVVWDEIVQLYPNLFAIELVAFLVPFFMIGMMAELSM